MYVISFSCPKRNFCLDCTTRKEVHLQQSRVNQIEQDTYEEMDIYKIYTCL